MADESDVKDPKLESPSRWQRGSAALARRIFNAELPEQFVRTIPAQSLYCVLKHNGMASSSDLLEIATIQQCRLMMDFDLWSGDTFQEDTFWEWLAITDATEGLELLQKLFKCFDLKLVSLLITRYVTSVIHEEPTDEPPGENYYSPDKGSTWIRVETGGDDRDFLLNRLLALIFETDADLFYQLMSIPGVATATQLEEESYQDRLKRLASEGIPEVELASELRLPLATDEALKLVKESKRTPRSIDVFIVEPLIYDSSNSETLGRLISSVRDKETLEGELTFLLNCAIVSWNIPHHEPEAVHLLVEQVKGAVSIGIEMLEAKGYEITDLYLALGLIGLFRLGHTQLMALQRRAIKIPNDSLKRIADSDKPLFALIAGLREPFPAFCQAPAGKETTAVKKEALPKVAAIDSLATLQLITEKLPLEAIESTPALE